MIVIIVITIFTNRILDIIDPRIEAIFYTVLECLKEKEYM